MPNWCSTTIAISDPDGRNELLDSFYAELEEAISIVRKESDFGTHWLGNVLTYFGFDYQKYSCRGEISCISREEDHIRIWTETAWAPMPEMWSAILSLERFEGLKMAYTAEEAGCEIFINSDEEGLFFTDRFMLDDFDTGEMEYFETFEALAEYVLEKYSIECSSIEELERSFWDDETHDVSIHQFEDVA